MCRLRGSYAQRGLPPEPDILFQTILDAASDAIVSMDESQRIVIFNKEAESVFGYKADEVMGKPLDVLLPEKFRAGHGGQVRKFALESVTRRRLNERMEVLGRRKNGEDFPAEIAISKFSRDGKFIFTAVLRDITGRKKAETDLKRYAEELKKSNQELGDFAFVASRDLQEPMRKIIAFADRLTHYNGAGMDERGRDYLRRLQNAASRMRERLDNLFEYSLVASGSRGFQSVDLNRSISEALVEMDTGAGEPGGLMEIRKLPQVEGDEFHMRQLFKNVLSNAVKFRGKERPFKVVVSARMGEEGFWQIFVEDNGLGFEQKHSKLIFKPFERLHGNEFPGDGMGLTICDKIVSRLGGAIAAKSAPNQGTTIIISLPEKQRADSNRPAAPTPDNLSKSP
ncbi:MAG: PAS domain S-box protein [Nitrospinae bacterium]|nr:PAS domain S-box protein [Nitrospinota bacterium]